MSDVEKVSPVTSHSPLATDPPEPAWIRDVSAAEIECTPRRPDLIQQMLSEICEGEISYCEHCGAGFPMWPPKGWADHLMTEHADNLTIQARTGTAMFCADDADHIQQSFFVAMIITRVSMRRRAWKLGYAVIKPAPEGRVKLSN